ncbi:PorT family protein [Flavobacterium amniphilum]|uniref:PorT family protein n=1 Tax=Flavobacterium amniphilum TaxID=1834035 RepID=UPI00202A7241|nr:PorT family protein [Flavobacterium amniphilum]MCL9803945.1 PorT family protein [Flavobacterium amniphilum]
MKKINYLLLLMCNCIFAQINYEKGYFIDNAGLRTDCFIKNEDWKNNPDKFYFKINEQGEENFRTIHNVKEFGVDNFSKYERHEVSIDISTTNLQRLGTNKNPEWSVKTLFLREIVDGDAKLYEFVDGVQKNYFYSFKGSKIEQLVYKEYLSPDNSMVLENNYYQQQLFNNLKCTDTKKERISRIDYKLNDLTKYFLEVNNCDGNKAITTVNMTKTSNGSTNIRVKGGVNSNKFTINSSRENYNIYPVEFENKIGGTAGVEIEHVLGFNKNKWAVFYEPSYHAYSSEKRKIVPSNTPYDWKVDFKSIDHRLGFRHYMFLNNESKIFISAGILYKQILGKEHTSLKINGNQTNSYRVDLKSGVGLNFGLGFSYKKSDFEIRYSKNDIIDVYYFVTSNYNTISVIYGYKIFDFKKKK